jgi:tetratricopeptide (TPR) repeat protein
MFKEERRGLSDKWAGDCARVMRSAVLHVLLAWPMAATVAEEAELEPPAGAAVATDLEEPAQFVPHDERAIDMDLDFALEDSPSADEGGQPAFADPPLKLEDDVSLAQPPSVGRGANENGSQGPGRADANGTVLGVREQVTPAEMERAQEFIGTAHALAVEASTSEAYSAVIEFCKRHEAMTQWSEARSYLHRLAAWAYNRRGEELIKEKRDVDALSDFNRAVQLDPRNWRATHNRAVSYAQAGDLARALMDFGQVIRLKPDYGPAYRNRGEVHFEAGKYAAAIEDYTRALAHVRQTDELYFLRADALHRLGRLPQALADYNASLESVPPDAQRLVGRAGVYAELGDYRAAIADLDQAIKQDPNCAEGYRAVAWILSTCPDARYRRPDKALLAARHALAILGESHPLYYDTLAAAYASSEDFDQAVAIQRQAVRLAAGQAEEEALRTRLALYDQSRPFVSPGPPASVDKPSRTPNNGVDRSAGRVGIREPLRRRPSLQ